MINKRPKPPYVIIYSIENGYQVLNEYEWNALDRDSLTFHNENGPALIWANTWKWFKKGKLHRLDGPAKVEFSANNLTYWIEGFNFTYDKYTEYVNEIVHLPLALRLTDPDNVVRAIAELEMEDSKYGYTKQA